MSVSDRLGRLLFIVPYVVHRDGVPLRELAQLLDVSVGQIEADINLLSMVGQPPLTPDHLIDLQIEDDIVYVELDQSLVRPLQLTHEEARSLAIGASLVGDLGGWGKQLEGVLARLVEHLAPVDREAVLALKERVLVHGNDALAHARCLRECICAAKLVRIAYYSASSDRQKDYTLKPLAYFTHSGDDYLVALDTEAGDHEKLFRLDRMGAVTALPHSFVPPADFDLEKFRRAKLYIGTDNLTARIRFAPALRARMRERFGAADIVRDDDAGLEVAVYTSSAAWLSRWVLGFGDQAEVLAPAVYRAYVHTLCARAQAAYARPPQPV